MSYVRSTPTEGESTQDNRRTRRQELARGWRFVCECSKCAEEAEVSAQEDVVEAPAAVIAEAAPRDVAEAAPEVVAEAIVEAVAEATIEAVAEVAPEVVAEDVATEAVPETVPAVSATEE